MQHVQTAEVPTMYFFGVDTARSGIMRIFPAWAKALGIPEARLVGLDFALRSDPARYREAVAFIREDPLSRGALVTSHKLDVMQAAEDLFDGLGPWAERLNEVSCISKRGGRLCASALDAPISREAMGQFIPEGHWTSSQAEVLLLGAGGAAVANACQLTDPARKEDRPAQIRVTDIDAERLQHLAAVVDSDRVEGIRLDVGQTADHLLANLPPGSLVINATGMGKDRPGSPISDKALWLPKGFAWELNYRGERQFLQQARAQEHVTVEDGWTYFLIGWTRIIAEVFDLDIDAERFKRLAALAETLR